MNSLERVRAAIEHRIPDRVPLSYAAEPEVHRRLMRDLKLPDRPAVGRHLQADIMRVRPRLTEAAQRRQPNGDWFDEWGARKQWVPHGSDGGYWEWQDPPLQDAQSIADTKSYRWPQIDLIDWERFSRDLDRYEGFVIQAGSLMIFAAYWFVRGLENALADPLRKPELARYLIGKMTDFTCSYAEKILEVADGRVHFVRCSDDWGMQTGLMMSPAMFRAFYEEPTRRLFETIRSHRAWVFCHSDGSVAELLDDLVELDFDVLDPVEVSCAGMDPDRLKRDYGDRICFHGAIDTREVLPRGTPLDVKRETLLRMAQLGRDGGYIVAPCHNLQADVPTENILALYETAREHGRYPLDISNELRRLGLPADAGQGGASPA